MADSSQRPKSEFVIRLHKPVDIEDIVNASLLCRPHRPEDLHWDTEDTFRISANDSKARAALEPAWTFTNLSSFVRQLNYYGFERQSDRREAAYPSYVLRRRTAERKGSSRHSGYVVFRHPTGNFVRSQPDLAHLIQRRARKRPGPYDNYPRLPRPIKSSRMVFPSPPPTGRLLDYAPGSRVKEEDTNTSMLGLGISDSGLSPPTTSNGKTSASTHGKRIRSPLMSVSASHPAMAGLSRISSPIPSSQSGSPDSHSLSFRPVNRSDGRPALYEARQPGFMLPPIDTSHSAHFHHLPSPYADSPVPVSPAPGPCPPQSAPPSLPTSIYHSLPGEQGQPVHHPHAYAYAYSVYPGPSSTRVAISPSPITDSMPPPTGGVPVLSSAASSSSLSSTSTSFSPADSETGYYHSRPGTAPTSASGSSLYFPRSVSGGPAPAPNYQQGGYALPPMTRIDPAPHGNVNGGVEWRNRYFTVPPHSAL